METKASWVCGIAAVVALCAAAMLIVAFLVTDQGVAQDVRSPISCAEPDVAPALLRTPPQPAAPAHAWM